jgi:hypothetical protein
MAPLRGCVKFKAWQPPVVEVDGQLGLRAVPQVVPSPSSKSADRENFKVLSLIITHYSENGSFRESLQIQ